ncbi:MAG TPA: ArsA-related P-loop ATPase [Ilumatobacter sp.]|nr:ArsA-related P-loop ATPase [Ilumatobacter sp.]
MAPRSKPRATAHNDLTALLAAKEMVLVCGSGGVGKTTVAAALAVAAAVEVGGRVLVLTVDPAKRLADALGVGALGNTARRVPNDAFTENGVEPRGELWAAMLDTKAGWDELIHRHAPDAKLRDSVLANPLYQNITSRFVHSHDYLAMEQLHELHASGRFDLIIVDTPPSRNALDVLDAPGRMKEFFGSRLLKWLTVPYRSRLFTFASKPFYQLADRILGSRFLQDVAEFFMLFQAMEPGFVRHANEVEQLLGDPRTTFIVVSTLEAAPSHEASYLARELKRRDFHLGAIVANRILPPVFTAPASATSARKLVKLADGQLADDVAETIRDAPGRSAPDRDVVASVLAEIGTRFHDVAVVATREAERRSELATLAPMLVAAPMLDRDVNDIADLYDLATALRS